MTLKRLLLFAIFFIDTHSFGQTRVLTGKVVDEKLYPLYQVRILNLDTFLLTTSERDGSCILTIPVNTKSLMIWSIAMERKLIDISDTCSNLDIIMLSAGSYDYMTPNKVDRERKKTFLSFHHFINLHTKKEYSKVISPATLTNLFQ